MARRPKRVKAPLPFPAPPKVDPADVRGYEFLLEGDRLLQALAAPAVATLAVRVDLARSLGCTLADLVRNYDVDPVTIACSLAWAQGILCARADEERVAGDSAAHLVTLAERLELFRRYAAAVCGDVQRGVEPPGMVKRA